MEVAARRFSDPASRLRRRFVRETRRTSPNGPWDVIGSGRGRGTTLGDVSAGVDVLGIHKHFGSLHALADVDLSVAPGEVLTLLGPSGCGKTTLLRLIAGLVEPDTGRITVDGGPPARARAEKRIGFVPQSPALLPWRTVRANASLLVTLNPRRSATTPVASVDELLSEVGLADFVDAHPHELSGGMRQRVGLVRAFALDAPLLLMDEPFAALDEMTRADMRHLLVRLRGLNDATVVFVTHSVAEAAFLSDRVAIMSPRPGRIAEIVPITLTHPRRPEVEDTSAFFDMVTTLRAALRDATGAT